jgi:hypothetical protein
MTEKGADDAHVRALLQEVRGEAVAKNVRCDALVYPSLLCGEHERFAYCGLDR